MLAGWDDQVAFGGCIACRRRGDVLELETFTFHDWHNFHCRRGALDHEDTRADTRSQVTLYIQGLVWDTGRMGVF
jgi:hypothetical protein